MSWGERRERAQAQGTCPFSGHHHLAEGLQTSLR